MTGSRNNISKRILFLATGGTLASRQSGEGLRPAINAEDIVRLIPTLREICEIDTRSIMNEDSGNMQPEDWIGIAETVFNGLDKFDGVVIAHGTDTMAYTSSALSFLIQNIKKPVIITGSMIPIIEDGTDAKRNLIDSFLTACEDLAGVFVVFNGKIIKGCRASKASSGRFDAFESVNYPYIGTIYRKKVRYYHNMPFPEKMVPPKLYTSISPDVFLLKLIPGTKPEIIDSLLDLGYRGVVIETFGAGGLPFSRRNLLQQIRKIIENGVSVADTTQCIYEGSDLTIDEIGRKALKQGVIPTYDMTTEAVVTKLMWALGQTVEPAGIREMMHTNYADEITI